MPTGSRSKIGRPSWISRAASPPRTARGGALASCTKSSARRHVLAGGDLEPAAELAREFLKGAALAGAELRGVFGRRRGERRYIGRGGLGFDRGRRWRCAGCAWRCSSAANRSTSRHDSKAAITGKPAVAVEHRQSRHFDRQGFVRVVDRPWQHDAAPGAARGKRARHGSLRIEFERGGDLGPGTA